MESDNSITLAEIDDDSAAQLVGLLNTDDLLLNALGSKKEKMSVDEFMNHNGQWAMRTNSEIFAILLDGSAIGMISLSHQIIEERKAQIGYWIGTQYWGKGYTSQAFQHMLKYARKKGIKYLSATIKRDNAASKRIWEKNNADMKLTEDRYHVSIML